VVSGGKIQWEVVSGGEDAVGSGLWWGGCSGKWSLVERMQWELISGGEDAVARVHMQAKLIIVATPAPRQRTHLASLPQALP
jgi:hypothetical protein